MGDNNEDQRYRMGDCIPIYSQAKSVFQLICLDWKGAWNTQWHFLRKCPVFSQCTSFVQWLCQDKEGALETQKQCGKFLLDVADVVPVVGHVKGGIHYAVGDREGGDQAMKAASRTVGVMAGGVAGALIFGPVGAVAGGVAGGAAMDGIITAADSLVHREYRPNGHLSNVRDLYENPKDPGLWFDTLTAPAMDGLTGYTAGNAAANILGRATAVGEAAGEVATITKAVVKATVKEVARPKYIALSSMYQLPLHRPGRLNLLLETVQAAQQIVNKILMLFEWMERAADILNKDIDLLDKLLLIWSMITEEDGFPPVEEGTPTVATPLVGEGTSIVATPPVGEDTPRENPTVDERELELQNEIQSSTARAENGINDFQQYLDREISSLRDNIDTVQNRLDATDEPDLENSVDLEVDPTPEARAQTARLEDLFQHLEGRVEYYNIMFQDRLSPPSNN